MYGREHGLGWHRELPDIRDYTPEHDAVRDMLMQTGALGAKKKSLKSKVDLSDFCSPVEDQGTLGSCTAQAAAGLIEYYERRACGEHIEASRLFLYKTTRNLLHWTGDTGAYLRTTMKAMVLFGAPPEEYWPHDISRFEEEPSAFCYSFGQSFRSIKYFRLDPPGVPADKLLDQVRAFLDSGYPSMFGFTVYNFGDDEGEFAFPTATDRVLGGHAVVAIGYDNDRSNQDGSVGAIKIRNSWGVGWGQGGYGWLPYEYVLQGLTADFWSLFKKEYVGRQFD